MDFRLPFIPFWPQPGDSNPREWYTPAGDPIPNLTDYLTDILTPPPPSDATPPPLPSLPSTDPLPLPQEPLAPSALPPPTPQAEALLAFPGLHALTPLHRLRRSRSANAESLEKSFSQAYGTSINMRLARKLARKKKTMRAQVLDTPVDPRSLPVPTGRAQTPGEMQDAIDAEGRRRATDEEVRRRARERGATQVPNRPPPSSSPRRRGRGVGIGAIFDPFELAEDFGAVAGEVVGEELYRQSDAEIEAAAQRERELARREKELYDRATQEVIVTTPRRAPPATPRGIEVYTEVEGRARSRSPLPVPAGLPPSVAAPKRNRMQRALSRVQQMTSNPWAQLGVFGLGMLGGKRRSRSQTMTPATAALVDDVVDLDGGTALTPGMLPFSASGYSFGGGYGTPTRTDPCNCKPKKRGPKRRCLERAQVEWRSGRYKGKLAGTRCVRWE